jgi:hypothetical protein
MATGGEAIGIATAVLDIASVVTKLASEAIEASRAGDDATALAKLDEAQAHFDAGSSAAKVALDRVKTEISDLINEKFDRTDAKPPGDEEPK